ncbi:Ferric reductase transmembrane component 1 [Madurella mycetomatis]|uniref:Ferric reductase transmembrane component 1 n=1 Tax=Madurella mycetomatis TaxID=100816 RepID=A0A175W4Y4_9PEZI|nr:Ferric reductase transmembrane component 1 [Madurella mycetomatis]
MAGTSDRTTICLQAQGVSWDALPVFLRRFCLLPISSTFGEGDDNWWDDPEKVEYLRQLIEAIYDARAIVASYNVVILFVILVLAVLHWRESSGDKQKWLRLRREAAERTFSRSLGRPVTDAIVLADSGKDVDVERVPLLMGTRATSGDKKNALTWRVSSWLERQPPPLPIINRTLPSNGTSLSVLAWLALNALILFFGLPLRWDFFFIFADRAGLLFVVNLPLLYLLSAKNQPLRKLTGYSYEALNIFHRRVGELMCFVAAVHFTSMVVWQFVLAEEWLLASQTPDAYFTHPLILFGIGALASYELLFFTSLASFRQRWYEIFLATHVLLQVAALVFLWFHFYTSRPYVALAFLIFAADRLVWRLSLKTDSITADISILDKDTYLLSADWDIPSAPAEPRPWWQQPSALLSSRSILDGWDPTDHVFLTVPILGRSHALQTHPFTIASAAPGRRRCRHPPSHATPTDGGDGERGESTASAGGGSPTHAWLSLLVRAHAGFTRDLLSYAAATGSRRVPVRLDGPYGSPCALGMLRASRCAVLVAGGSGIAVAFPLVWALLHEEGPPVGNDDGAGDEDRKLLSGRGRSLSEAGKLASLVRPLSSSSSSSSSSSASESSSRAGGMRTVHLLWVTHSREHREWVPREQLEELRKRGLDLVIPEPTAEAGRPDVARVVTGWIEEATMGDKEIGVVVSGPDGLNRLVRNVCADAVGRGRDVRIAVEKFGW